ncbi:M48 family metalloprotease [Paludibacterium purpuratum]|uniref:Putative metalloprotease n=1 Tax=Paludibacterium purpuratum TaxID=1144873 RepID=A0A4R7AYR8_9NEIS|nr:M48 family metalloprotease [Paludibacterium purpuratum]TDR73082.1 putative metalloprotease [Paludibacterium purpuratum]
MKLARLILPCCLLLLPAWPAQAVDLTSAIGAALKLLTASTLSDDNARTLALDSIHATDAKNHVAPPSNPYSKRLARVTRDFQNEDGLALNFKVYLTKDVNASCSADGSVRVYSGLMDMMNDDELRFVLGHEIGHARLGHTRKQLQLAYATSALRDAAAATGNQAAVQLSQSAVGDLAETLLHAQFSQSEETEADEYGVHFLRLHGFKLQGALSAMSKIQTLSDDHSWLADHPASSDRLAHLQQLVGAAP